MRFLVDAQLPKRLAYRLSERGFDAKHTLDLTKGNLTKDSEINELSIKEQRVVVTKDEDFVNSILVSKKPYKLLLVSTGNIANRALELIFDTNLDEIANALGRFDYIELTRTALIEHI